jgi:hypothetical protein
MHTCSPEYAPTYLTVLVLIRLHTHMLAYVHGRAMCPYAQTKLSLTIEHPHRHQHTHKCAHLLMQCPGPKAQGPNQSFQPANSEPGLISLHPLDQADSGIQIQKLSQKT